MLGQLPREDEPDCSLDLAGGHCGLLVVACQLGCLCGNLLKDVIDEGVQDGHCLGADTCVRVHLKTKTNISNHFELGLAWSYLLCCSTFLPSEYQITDRGTLHAACCP